MHAFIFMIDLTVKVTFSVLYLFGIYLNLLSASLQIHSLGLQYLQFRVVSITGLLGKTEIRSG